jgi:hypothetical protein
MNETHFTRSGASPPEVESDLRKTDLPARPRPDFTLYFKKSRTKPTGSKFKIHQPAKTKDDLRRLRASLRAKPKHSNTRRPAPEEAK